jgi:hypothetical protein
VVIGPPYRLRRAERWASITVSRRTGHAGRIAYQTVWVFRIRLGVRGLARTRFVISPLAEVFSLLELVIRPASVPTSRRAWMVRTQAVLRRDDMPLLRALAVPGYLPDLLTPQPNGPGTDVMAELCLVRSTPAARVRAEMTAMRDGRPEAGLAPRPRSPI